jgi:hypothetical protein
MSPLASPLVGTAHMPGPTVPLLLDELLEEVEVLLEVEVLVDVELDVLVELAVLLELEVELDVLLELEVEVLLELEVLFKLDGDVVAVEVPVVEVAVLGWVEDPELVPTVELAVDVEPRLPPAVVVAAEVDELEPGLEPEQAHSRGSSSAVTLRTKGGRKVAPEPGPESYHG